MSPYYKPIPFDSWSSTPGVDEYQEDDHEEMAEVLLGHRVEKVSGDHLLLDDGTTVRLVGHDGGCSCNSGCYDLTELNGVDNIITSVEFEDEPGEDGDTCPTCNESYCYGEAGHVGSGNGTYRIFVFADNQRINLATFEGTDGNGYYGTGYHFLVRRSEEAMHDDV